MEHGTSPRTSAETAVAEAANRRVVIANDSGIETVHVSKPSCDA